MSGTLVAFLTPPSAAGGGSKLAVYDAKADRFLLGVDRTLAAAVPATEFVIGGDPDRELVAFTTREAEAGEDLNGDKISWMACCGSSIASGARS